MMCRLLVHKALLPLSQLVKAWGVLCLFFDDLAAVVMCQSTSLGSVWFHLRFAVLGLLLVQFSTHPLFSFLKIFDAWSPSKKKVC